MEGLAKGFSLWLMPEGEPRDRLAARIDALAARFRTDRFPPHLTLVSGIEGEDADRLAGARDAAQALAPFKIRFAGVAGRDEYFRCLFLRAVRDDVLRAAHAAAASACGREPEASFLPHLSLLYGRLAPAHKPALARELVPVGGLVFEARRLHLWRTEGPVSEWREIGVFDLAGRPGLGPPS